MYTNMQQMVKNTYFYSNNKKYLKTRGSQEPVITHLVFNLTSKVDRKWGWVLHVIWKVGHPKIISTQISEQKI